MEDQFRRIDALPDNMDAPGAVHPKKGMLRLIAYATGCGVVHLSHMAALAAAEFDRLRPLLGLGPRPPSWKTVGRAAPFMPEKPEAEPLPALAPTTNASAPLPPIANGDGKVLRGSRGPQGAKAESVVSVAQEGRTIGLEPLGPAETKSGKEGEIPAMLRLLPRCSSGRMITLDALFCLRSVAETILESGGTYAIACKSNAGGIFEQIERLFEENPIHDRHSPTEPEIGHGRVELRTTETISDPWLLGWPHVFPPPPLHSVKRRMPKGPAPRRKPEPKPPEPGFPSLACVSRTMRMGVGKKTGKATAEIAYHLFGLPVTAEDAAAIVRGHWSGVENGVHLPLDTAFQEDSCRVRGAGALALAKLRRVALDSIRTLFPLLPVAQAFFPMSRRMDAMLAN